MRFSFKIPDSWIDECTCSECFMSFDEDHLYEMTQAYILDASKCDLNPSDFDFKIEPDLSGRRIRVTATPI